MNELPFLIGIMLAVCIGTLARWTRFDRDISFYPTILIVIASYYLLFALMVNASGLTVLTELLLSAIFFGLAVAGALRWFSMVGAGLMLHALMDYVHPNLVQNSGVPTWWPMFCAGFDLTLGIWALRFVSLHRGGGTRTSEN